MPRARLRGHGTYSSDADLYCLERGVTTAVDTGSTATRHRRLQEYVIRPRPLESSRSGHNGFDHDGLRGVRKSRLGGIRNLRAHEENKQTSWE